MTYEIETKPTDKLSGEATGIRDAQRKGLTYYWTGRPCQCFRYEWRYASSGNCMGCFNDYVRKGHAHAGRPPSGFRRYDALPAPLQRAEDIRVGKGMTMGKLSLNAKRNVHWYRDVLKRASDDGSQPALSTLAGIARALDAKFWDVVDPYENANAEVYR